MGLSNLRVLTAGSIAAARGLRRDNKLRYTGVEGHGVHEIYERD